MDDQEHTSEPAVTVQRSNVRKRTIYLPQRVMLEIEAEARRQDCSFSRIVRLCWQDAREGMIRYPAVESTEGQDRVGA